MAEPVQSVKEVFEVHIPARLKAKPDLIGKINAVYQFHIAGAEGGNWSVDCTQPGGAVAAGTAAAPRCTVSMADADFLKLVERQAQRPDGLHDREDQDPGRHGAGHEAPAAARGLRRPARPAPIRTPRRRQIPVPPSALLAAASPSCSPPGVVPTSTPV